jgi:DNA mismatch repair protein MutL
MDPSTPLTNTSTRIRLLPESLANQIAAGEVVQRPASVVKELMENALDAGSKRFILQLEDAGKKLIQLTDDGCGMSPLDARMAFERHATSKLLTLEDLFSIQTMGFRGEALASIAAVAQVELRTRLHTEEIGTVIRVEGGSVSAQESCATPPGTTIAVSNLFFNVPARRNFLKSNPVEMRHIHHEFARIALAYPEFHFEFHHNGLAQQVLKPCEARDRIAALSAIPQDALLELHAPDEHLSIQGWILSPFQNRVAKGEQYLWVNGRFIRSAYLNHAIARAYESVMQPMTQPAFFLHLTTDPRNIDINIHPTKTEIKFSDESRSYQLMFQAVRQALSKWLAAPPETTNKKRSQQAPKSSLSVETDEGIKIRPGRLSGSTPPWLPKLEAEALPKQTLQNQWSAPPKVKAEENYAGSAILFHVEGWSIRQLDDQLAWASYQNELWLIAHTRIKQLFARPIAALADFNLQPDPSFGLEHSPAELELKPSEALVWSYLEPHLLDLGIRTKLSGSNLVQVVDQPQGTDGLAILQSLLHELFEDVPNIREGDLSCQSSHHQSVDSWVRFWIKLGKPEHCRAGKRLALRIEATTSRQIFESFF